MKKKKDDEDAVAPISDGAGLVRDSRLKTALQSVFRLTHNREMTAEERQEFGLGASASNRRKTSSKK